MQRSCMLQKMRQDAIRIFNAGLAAVEPEDCIHRCCRLERNILEVGKQTYDLDKFDEIIIIGAGKAGASMASAVEEILGNRITAGLIIVKYDHVKPLHKIDLVEAGHPIPDENGVAGAKKILEFAENADEKTLVICLISGGGSALMALPSAGLTLKDKQETTEVLLGCGAAIHEINTIRKHLSRIKGGFLAEAAYPATMVCLVLSDVVGDNLETIASGPAAGDAGTFGQCLEIIKAHGIKDHIPKAAGAIADHTTVERASALGLAPEQFLKDNNSYEFFDRISDLFKTGPTNTNVMDIAIMLIR